MRWITRSYMSWEIGAGLRAARRSRGLSLEQVARAAGIDPGYLSRLERGHRALSTTVADRLVVAYGIGGTTLASRLFEEAAVGHGEDFQPRW